MVKCNSPRIWKSVVLDILFKRVFMIRSKWCSTEGSTWSPILDRMILSTYLRSAIPTHSKTLSKIVMRTVILITGFFKESQSKFNREHKSYVFSWTIIFWKAVFISFSSTSFNKGSSSGVTFSWMSWESSYFYLDFW